jgi:hypothetical protein
MKEMQEREQSNLTSASYIAKGKQSKRKDKSALTYE